ncbi:MAG: HAMP domain-containing sensor histidine kinase, partial [Halobacteriovoraceae bacterium]|nr:HAMP domain-containing sensor histidine kinase [Halobacteriovoraceae bacterium]
LSQAQTAFHLLSRDINDGNYRKVMEKLKSAKWADSAETKSILFYDLTSNQEVTSNLKGIELLCQKSTSAPSLIQNENYTACIPFNAALLIQITFKANPFTFLAQQQFITILIYNLIVAGILVFFIIISMNSYLNRFISLLNRTVTQGGIDQNTPVEFKSSLKEIGKLAKTLDFLKSKLAEKAKSDLAGEIYAKVIHNIRDPLNNINIALPSHKDDFNKETEEVIRNSLKEIETSVAKALDSYRTNKSINLYKIIEQARTEADLRTTSKNITINPIMGDNAAKSYNKKIDPTDFKAAIVNMLTNAIEAMPNGGNISIEMSCDKRLSISIIDEGIGIDENILPKIGQKGFSHNKEKGTGIGFYSSKKDIESWGGSLSIKNRSECRGAKVTIIL